MLGVCYYPEHWPESYWADDATEMKSLGLEYVRIGEFSWSRIEPSRGQFQFDWLDRAIETLASTGLKVVFGTPTATPPKWLIDEHPSILPVDPMTAATRGFGSRRHYDFSSPIYLKEAQRITKILAERYGKNAAVVGWQTDNELSCHDTTLSGSENAKIGFRKWCKDRYGSIEQLNAAWGTVFWSMEYTSFDQIDLPISTVTEAHPAHQLAFRRYSSDQVVNFHNEMVAIIREHAPGKWITHNFIPKEDISADTYALGAPLDFASYDNYPLGRTDMRFADQPETMRQYMRTGHPDFSSFYHDTTRSFSAGAFWVMEQQPGPVNWAPHNPKPLPGMIRLWSLEAFAHGAACVSYFRWRQVPFGQEQLHAGLKLPDNRKSDAWDEVTAVNTDLEVLKLNQNQKEKSKVAIITDVQALWLDELEVQGAGYDFKSVEFSYYSALRKLGVDVDFISPSGSFDGYEVIVAPCLPMVDDAFINRCLSADAYFVFGPRSGSKTAEFSIPEGLAPGKLQELLPFKVRALETLRPDCLQTLTAYDKTYEASVWCEHLEPSPDVTCLAHYASGSPAAVCTEKATYLGCVSDNDFLRDLFLGLCKENNIKTYDTSEHVRICHRGELGFAFNYGDTMEDLPLPSDTKFILGGKQLAPQDVAVWRQANNQQ